MGPYRITLVALLFASPAFAEGKAPVFALTPMYEFRQLNLRVIPDLEPADYETTETTTVGVNGAETSKIEEDDAALNYEMVPHAIAGVRATLFGFSAAYGKDKGDNTATQIESMGERTQLEYWAHDFTRTGKRTYGLTENGFNEGQTLRMRRKGYAASVIFHRDNKFAFDRDLRFTGDSTSRAASAFALKVEYAESKIESDRALVDTRNYAAWYREDAYLKTLEAQVAKVNLQYLLRATTGGGGASLGLRVGLGWNEGRLKVTRDLEAAAADATFRNAGGYLGNGPYMRHDGEPVARRYFGDDFDPATVEETWEATTNGGNVDFGIDVASLYDPFYYGIRADYTAETLELASLHATVTPWTFQLYLGVAVF